MTALFVISVGVVLFLPPPRTYPSCLAAVLFAILLLAALVDRSLPSHRRRGGAASVFSSSSTMPPPSLSSSLFQSRSQQRHRKRRGVLSYPVVAREIVTQKLQLRNNQQKERGRKRACRHSGRWWRDGSLGGVGSAMMGMAAMMTMMRRRRRRQGMGWRAMMVQGLPTHQLHNNQSQRRKNGRGEGGRLGDRESGATTDILFCVKITVLAALISRSLNGVEPIQAQAASPTVCLMRLRPFFHIIL